MNLDRYDYITDPAYASFSFHSVGPNGSIRKIINYQAISGFVLRDGRQVINLGFGDWDEVNNMVDDSTVTNNQDRDKVLSTVAATIFTYCEKHGKLLIFAKGSSGVKTRLYQMSINAHLAEVERFFYVFGLLKDGWRKFVPGTNYEAFLVIRE